MSIIPPMPSSASG